MISYWLSDNWIEIFGAVTGIIYVFLEVRQNLWLWPVGIITSSVYVWVFLTGKLYADMSLQVYYLAISFTGLYWWVRGTGHRTHGGSKSEAIGTPEKDVLPVTRLKFRTGLILSVLLVFLYALLWFVLSRYTDSPVPEADSFITSLSVIATWMLARKIFEHWYLWIVVNLTAVILFLIRGLYPTVILYMVYLIMSFSGLSLWKKTIKDNN
ncbi:MAG: nicotinamide mononucleotide transporter [Bacteroidales bacterium]|nr:nicotinamide mononucleotide transporter [Bacteroidales bacterium]